MIKQFTAIMLWFIFTWVSLNHIIDQRISGDPTYLVGIFMLWMLGTHMAMYTATSPMEDYGGYFSSK